MEALGAGANVAAFVVVAAQLSKVLYTTFISIQDGPDAVRRVTNHMQQLHGVLEQLKLSPLIAHDDALIGHIALCVKDLNQLADDVMKLQVLPGEQRTGRLWKRFRCFLDEKKLDEIRDQLIQHTSTLSLRHSVLQSNAIYQTLSNARRATRSIEVLNEKFIQRTQEHATEFNTLSHNVQCLLESQTDTLRSNLSSIQASIEGIASVSHTNSDTMLDVLNEIKALVTNKASQEHNKRGQGFWCAPDQHSNPGGGTGVVENPEEISPNNDLIRTVTRLCDLIKLKNQTYNVHEEYDSVAEDIIEDLQTLLSLARRYGYTANKAHEVDPAVLRSEVRRFNQAFAQFSLTINAEGQRRNERAPFKTITQKQTYAKIQVTDLGTLTLRVTKRTQASSTIVEDTRQHEARDSDHAMVVTFMPYDPSKFNMIVASTLQRHFWGNAAPSISRLDVNRVLPRDAPVFEVIRQGRLEKFREILQNGEASLRDHDEFGANLLMYSTKNPELCKFMLSTNSFDLDHVGGDAGVMYRTDASYLSSVLDLISPERGRGDTGKCRRLLLEAGVDPTIQIEGRTFVERISTHGSYDAIREFWDLASRCYFDSYFNDAKLGPGQALLAACWHVAWDFKRKISLFLERGADITMRDSLGRSCLHICFSHLHRSAPSTFISTQLEGIIYLLDNGADAYACDYQGVSVSEVAYEKRSLSNSVGSMLGDLWDSALHSCGYDIAKFRQHHQRRAAYTRLYERKDFITLWSGKPHECPYLDDTPWPQPKLWQLPEFEYSDEELDEEVDEGVDEETEEEIDCERDYRSDSIISWLATITAKSAEHENVFELPGDDLSWTSVLVRQG
ncbi:ankyrin [Xylaria sp. FL0933]|nr:ankyrin [Xylaria sp. FL0933]